MPKKVHELTAIAVKNLKRPGRHAIGGVPGLFLVIGEGDAKSWIVRVTVAGRRRDIGLGGYDTVTLAEAREKARDIRKDALNGIDPIIKRREQRKALLDARNEGIKFMEAAEFYVRMQQSQWRNRKHVYQWRQTLESYVYPVIGKMPVKDIKLQDVLTVLQPIWTTKTETATRVRGRIEKILDWAIVQNYRAPDNPARWKGYLDKVLPPPSKIATVKHHRALPVADMPEFMRDLLAREESSSSLALAFAVLTAARSGEVRGATWDEIDFDNATWTIPAERMKAGREHRVPLSPAALDILRRVQRHPHGDFIFTAPFGGKLSDMAITLLMRRMEVNAVPHGFRSTFRDWIAEKTDYPNHVAEMALAHTIGNKVEAAYRRGDLFEKRREMMNEWAGFCMELVL
jgi:integrase